MSVDRRNSGRDGRGRAECLACGPESGLERIIDRIGTLGIERMGEPHTRHLEGKLWEMRPSGRHLEGRALHVTAAGRRVVIVLAFIKKTRKTPGRLIRLALERAKRVE